jgi:hypothetical protein
MHKFIVFLVFAAALGAGSVATCASERESLEQLRGTTLGLIQALVEQGVLSKEKADAIVREAESRAKAQPTAKDAKPATIRVPYVPEVVRNEIREQLKQEIIAQARTERWAEPNAVPSWLDRISLDADLRVRLQLERFQNDNAPPAFFQVQGQTNVTNTLEDRERLNIRARLGLLLNTPDDVSGGMRFTTGSSNSPVSTSSLLGNTFGKHSVALDRAWLRLQPLDWMRLQGGRMPNPFFGTDLVWHNDLGFDGAALQLAPFKQPERTFKPYLTLGVFPVQEVELSSKDKWLYGLQAGAEYHLDSRTRLKFAAAYYDYRNIAGQPNAPSAPNLFDFTAPQFRQKGNTVFNIDADGNPATNLYALAAKYRLANLTAVLAFAQWDPVHVVLAADAVKNVGFDRNEIRARTGLDVEPQVRGHQIRLTLGHPRINDKHDWQVFAGHRYLQSDAVLDAFNDTDFHLGGTNHKGYSIGGSYGIGRNTSIGFRWMSSKEISGAPLSIDVLQFDLSARF